MILNILLVPATSPSEALDDDVALCEDLPGTNKGPKISNRLSRGGYARGTCTLSYETLNLQDDTMTI